LLWAVTHRRIKLAGVLLGLAVHFKIYPFIYGPSIIWFLEEPTPSSATPGEKSPSSVESLRITIRDFLNPLRLNLLLTSLTTFTLLNVSMYALYSTPFLTHTYLHHLTRIDHRHNFSPYNTLLHLSSALRTETTGWKFESMAFVPQLALSAGLIPWVLAKRDLGGAMLAQTWAFVGWNKVVTSQVGYPPQLLFYFIIGKRANS